MMLMGYWSCAVQPGTAMTAHGDDEVRRHKGCRTFLLRPRARRPSDPELPSRRSKSTYTLPHPPETARRLKVTFCVRGVLSPLLANIYMRRFVLGWKKLGLERSLGTRLVTYADDLVILCRRGNAENALHHLRAIMGKLKLTVNEEKTQIFKVPDGEFDFLGYTFGRMYSPTTGKARLGYRPSKKSIKRMVEKVH